MKTFTLTAVALLSASTVHAEPYELPTDAWYQVALGDLVVCESGSPCDIDRTVDHRLLRFDSKGVTETRIPALLPGGPSITTVRQPCGGPQNFVAPFGDLQAADWLRCTATCPTGTVLISTECEAPEVTRLDVARLIGSDIMPTGELTPDRRTDAHLIEAAGGSCTWGADSRFFGIDIGFAATAVCLRQ